MERWDEIGEYICIEGFCVRDAFRQFFGNHPVIRGWFPDACTTEEVKRWCDQHGYRYEFGGRFSGNFRVGQAVIWFYSYEWSDPNGHATFCRDPRRIVEAQEAGRIFVSGYVLLED